MKPKTQGTEDHERLIQDAQELFEADQRVAAAWLEGSFGSGRADAWSDVDLHIAVYDAEFTSFMDERLSVLRRLRPILAFGENPLPSGAHLIYATLQGPIRLDLYVERLGELEAATRWEVPRVLFERVPVTERLVPNADLAEELPPWLEGLVRNFFFGSMWPVRMWGREEWGSLLMNTTAITFQFLVPAIIAQENPSQFYRPHYHNERYLPDERRREVWGLLEEALGAFSGIGDGEPDVAKLIAVHEKILSRIWAELRGACAKWGVTYPEDAEREMQEYYQRELGMIVSAPS